MFKLFRTYRIISKCFNTKPLLQRRYFLSEAFECKLPWNRRLDSQILQKVKLEDMHYELDGKYNQTGTISAIDVDIFANAIKDDTHLDELEDLIHKFRLTAEANNIIDSTHHAFIRAFLSFGSLEELLRILNDRLNYGIFLDDYCSILLINTCLKNSNFRDAAKVGTLHMLQEDFSNPLVLYLSLYSCHKYLLNPTEWEKIDPSEEKQPDDDGEETYVRVKYIRNPYFDDHFDLKTNDDLIGKTLMMTGSLINDELGNSYTLIGCGLFKKWEKARTHLENVYNNNKKIYKEAISMFKECLSKGKTESEKNFFEELMALVELVQKGGFVLDNDLLNSTEERLKSCIAEQEPKLIASQIQLYEDWENMRETWLLKELERLDVKKRLEDIAKKKEELLKKEEELFFFEKENELDLKAENKKVIYPKKWLGKKKKKPTQLEDYVPPDVNKKLV